MIKKITSLLLFSFLLFCTAGAVPLAPQGITAEFFDFTKQQKLFYQSDWLKLAENQIFPEIKRRYPELNEAQARQITANFLNDRTPGIPRKSKDEAGFMEFLAIRKFMTERNPSERYKKRFLAYGLKLAAKYPESLVTAQLVFRGLKNAGSIRFLNLSELNRKKLHPYLKLMLQGEYFARLAWKIRGGGYADTVTEKGWQGFAENIDKAVIFFEKAHQQYPEAPEAAAAMIEMSLHLKRLMDNKVFYLKKALQAQADHFDAMSAYTWFSRPRWCGTEENLLREAKMFFALTGGYPRLARNGLHLLQAYLTEIPVAGNIRYFSIKENYTEVKNLFDTLAAIQPLSPGEKMFYGTAALLADDRATCQKLIKSFTKEDIAFAKTLRHGGIPQLYWINFPALHDALGSNKIPADGAVLENLIKNEKNPTRKKALIEFYIVLEGKMDILDYRGWMPGVYRLCSDFKSDKQFLKKVLDMGADVEAGSPVTGIRPLYFGLKDKTGDELLTLLLKAGADPNAPWGIHPPLYYSLIRGLPQERIRQLLEAGADPDQRFGANFTALHGCIKKHEAVKLLIEYKAQLNVVSKYRQTPLDLAEKYGSPETVRLLRAHGAKRASEL